MTLTRLVCVLALDLHVAPTELLAMPADLLDELIVTWQKQVKETNATLNRGGR